jgi:hypothetical protein
MEKKNPSLLFVASALATCGFVPKVTANEAAFDSIRRCAAIMEPTERLACFDRAVASLGSTHFAPATQTSATPSTLGSATDTATVSDPVAGRTATTVAPTLPTEQKFGATGALRTRQEPTPKEPALEQLTSGVSAVRKTPAGELVVTLANGQVWRQVTPSTMMLKAGDSVTIKPRSMGSFWMTDPTGRGSRVKRIQ